MKLDCAPVVPFCLIWQIPLDEKMHLQVSSSKISFRIKERFGSLEIMLKFEIFARDYKYGCYDIVILKLALRYKL